MVISRAPKIPKELHGVCLYIIIVRLHLLISKSMWFKKIIFFESLLWYISKYNDKVTFKSRKQRNCIQWKLLNWIPFNCLRHTRVLACRVAKHEILQKLHLDKLPFRRLPIHQPCIHRCSKCSGAAHQSLLLLAFESTSYNSHFRLWPPLIWPIQHKTR